MKTKTRATKVRYASAEFPLHFGIYNRRGELILSGHLKHRSMTALVLDGFTDAARAADREVLAELYHSRLPRPDFGLGPHEPPEPASNRDRDFWHLFLRRLQQDCPEYHIVLSSELESLLDTIVVGESARTRKPAGFLGGWRW